MNFRKRRSDRSERSPLFSGRPPVAGRDERRRFWAAVAAGMASEDAAVGVGVLPAVGTRSFRKAGGMPPSMFGISAKPLTCRISRLRSGRRSRCSACRATPCRRSLAGSGERRRRSLESCGATPPPRSGGLEFVRRQRNGTPSALLAAQSTQGLRATRRYEPTWRNGWLASSWLRAGLMCQARSCPGKVGGMDRGRKTPGDRLEPGADRPSPAGGLPGRRDHAHQP
jgi:hypothetical protein